MMALTGEPQETTAAPRTTGEPRVVWTAADASRRTPRPRLVRKPSAICLEWLNREELMVHQQAAIRHACGVNPPPPSSRLRGYQQACATPARVHHQGSLQQRPVSRGCCGRPRHPRPAPGRPRPDRQLGWRGLGRQLPEAQGRGVMYQSRRQGGRPGRCKAGGQGDARRAARAMQGHQHGKTGGTACASRCRAPAPTVPSESLPSPFPPSRIHLVVGPRRVASPRAP